MTLTKHDLVIRISEETGLVQTQVFDAVQKTLDQISEGLAKGGKVELRNFGVFEVKITKARVGRNPKQPGTDVPIPARTTVKFKAGKEMKAEVLKLTPKTPQEMSVMTTPSTWFYWALLSAVFAALTDIFAKIGIQGVDSDFATLIYTAIIIIALAAFVRFARKWSNPPALPSKRSAGKKYRCASEAVKKVYT